MSRCSRTYESYKINISLYTRVSFVAIIITTSVVVHASNPIKYQSIPTNTTASVWLNSVHLQTIVPIEFPGYDHRLSMQSPVSLRGTALLQRLETEGLSWEELFNNPRLMLSIVLASCSSVTSVIPTENYYYYEIWYQGVNIAGNIRVSDANDGIIHCGYYLRSNPQNSRYAAFGSSDDICISMKNSAYIDEITIQDDRTDISVIFLSRKASSLRFSDNLILAYSELIVSPIIDESGNAFALVYDTSTCKFDYYLCVQSPEDPAVWIEDWSCWYAPRSGFVYLEDIFNRLQLIGVCADEIRSNSFYDGPFDQVPPRLHLREFLRAAYPGLESARGDSLDQHGNWINTFGTRVAIMPYIEYERGDEATVYSKYIQQQSWLQIRKRIEHDPKLSSAHWQEKYRILKENASQWQSDHDVMVSVEQLSP